MHVLVPSRLREPPLISRITTSGRILRSVRLWSALSPSTRTNWTNSSSCRSKRLTRIHQGCWFARGGQIQRVRPCHQYDPLLLARLILMERLRVRVPPALGVVVQRPHVRCQHQHHGIVGMGLLQPVQIAQQMHPAALTLAGIAIVAAGAVADQTARELPIQNAPDDVLASYS